MCSIHYDLSPTPIKYKNAKCFFKTFSAKKQRRRNQHNTYSMCIIQEIHLNNNNNNWYSVTTQYTQLNFQIHSCIESLARFSFFLLDHYYYVHFFHNYYPEIIYYKVLVLVATSMFFISIRNWFIVLFSFLSSLRK